MESHSPLLLAELLTARLCHDLVTPISAINTGLELFQETPPDHLTESEEILNLILHSSETASARLSFFRVAFGYGGGRVSLGEAKDLIEKYFLRSKMEFHWESPFHNDLTLDGWSRLLLTATLWMSESAPRGGKLHISTPTEGYPALLFRLKADSIIVHEGTLEALEGGVPIESLTPRTIACYLIHCLIKKSKGTFKVDQISSPSELVLEIKGEGL